MKHKRTGDISFHPISQLPEGIMEIKHNGQFTYGVGEKSNHNHIITVPNFETMHIYQDAQGNRYYNLTDDAVLTHELGDTKKTADHLPITIKKGLYKQVQEREIDIFTKVVRKVLD